MRSCKNDVQRFKAAFLSLQCEVVVDWTDDEEGASYSRRSSVDEEHKYELFEI